MRHKLAGRKFSRTSAHRKAMFKNMSVSLIENELIIEPIITHAKNHDDVAGRRLAFSRLRDRKAVQKLFTELAPRYKERAGGYVRILKCGHRPGDQAPMAYVELVDRPVTDDSE